MEIPVIDRISGFEAEINRLHDPSLISRIFHLLRIEEISHIHSFWTWGALILAFFATFGSVISRVKFVIIRFRKGKSIISEPLIRTVSSGDCEDDDDETCSSSSSSDDEDDEPTSPFDEDSRVAGSDYYDEVQGHNRKLKLSRCRSSGGRFSWSDFANGKSVVKSWEGLGLGLGLGLGFENSSESVISLWDLNKNEITCSFYGCGRQIPAVSMPSPAVIVSAGLENSSNVALRVWDTRVGRQTPEIFAEWKPRRRKVVGIDSSGVDKLCVRDDGSSVAIRDIRNVGSPLEGLTESDLDTWWDADAVILDGDHEL